MERTKKIAAIMDSLGLALDEPEPAETEHLEDALHDLVCLLLERKEEPSVGDLWIGVEQSVLNRREAAAETSTQ